MTIRVNSELALLLAAAATQYDQVRILDAALTANKRVKAKRVADAATPQANVWANGVLFRDAALTGSFQFNNTDIVGYGVTSDLTVSLPADLASGISVLRFEGGGHWVEGTLGLAGSGADFVIAANPTASNSIAISTATRIKPVQTLPLGIPDTIAPTVSVAANATSLADVAPQVTITASPADADSGVAKVEFYRSGVLLATKTAEPWALTDTVTYLDNGTRHYYAKAYDAAGNLKESNTVPVTVAISYPTEAVTAVALNATITTVTMENTAAVAVNNQPVTFGQVFKRGALPGTGANLQLVNATTGVGITTQMDIRAVYDDGSIKHAVISTLLPAMTAGQSVVYNIVRRSAGPAAVPPQPSDFSNLDAVVAFTQGGTTYSISLITLLAGTRATWLSGDVVSEWEVSGIPKTGAGVEHPNLFVKFNVRGYKGLGVGRIDIAVENSWAMTAPADITYDVAITSNAATLYAKTALVHYQDTRWRNVFWVGAVEPPIYISHNSAYLIASKAVPNYDPTVTPSATAATSYKNGVVNNGGPMKNGFATAAMGTTGGRPDIGILPGWTALYVISMFKDAKTATLGQGDLAGSWGIHIRDKNTGKVISFNDYPNFPQGRPVATVATANPNVADRSHHPDMTFIPYMVTGDVYYLEELHFWAMYCAWGQNYQKREGAKGLVHSDQPRGQAWCIRTFAHAAWVTPAGVKKTEFEYILQSNIDWYNTRYTNNPSSDSRVGFVHHNLTDDFLGYVTFGSANAIASWMDDYITAAVGRTVELGYKDALPLLAWKAKFVTNRLYGVPGVCWIQAAAYQTRCRDGGNDTPIYDNQLEVYNKTMSPAVIAAAKASNCATQEMATAWQNYNAWSATVSGPYMDGVSNPIVGDMDGYSDSDTGYPSCLQPAVAYCTTFKTRNSQNAWDVFMGRTVKPTYSSNPQFAIVPRD